MPEDIFGFDQDGVDAIRDGVKRAQKWGTPSLGGDSGSHRLQFSQVMVGVIGIETGLGSGYYKGTIYYGTSNGGNGGNASNVPAKYNFQIQQQSVQTQIDGPKPLTDANGSFINNALVVNLAEPNVVGSHILYDNTAFVYCAIGRIMGATAEATPRTIVYVDSWPLRPVVAEITAHNGDGMYVGRIGQGRFSDGSSISGGLYFAEAGSSLPTQANCMISNGWEQSYAANANLLAVGTYVIGVTTGQTNASPLIDGNANGSDIFYEVFTWTQPQMTAITGGIQAVTTIQTANATYGTNEENMLNALKADMNNLRAELHTLYSNLQGFGYSL
jgi:hypothetical protein